MSEPEVVIVGAGVAGIAAAHRFRAHGVDCVVLEAADRVGGRGRTDRETLGFPYDLGCHWLHSADRNPLTPIALRAGFALVHSARRRHIHGRSGWASEAEIDDWALFEHRQFVRVEQVRLPERDAPVSTLLDRDHRWAGLYEAWFGILNGAAPSEVSMLDAARYRDSGDNRHVRDGLGAFIEQCGGGLPVRLSTPVRELHWDGDGVVVHGPGGRLRARAALVTASTTALANARIRFVPRLPDAKYEAFETLRLGYALRIGIRFPPDAFAPPCPTGGIFAGDSADALSIQVRAFGRPFVSAYAGARMALELERAGLDATRAFVLERVEAMFGSDFARRAGVAVMSGWAAEPDIGGAYSFARPGGLGAREELATPVAERLWFAGEAASIPNFSTAHGAWETGRDAADAIAASLGARRPTRVAHPVFR